MTQDEIIRMAREAGFEPNSTFTVMPMKDYANHGISYELERFAVLIAAHEREACAKVCKDLANSQFESGEIETAGVLDHCAAAIRARGEK